MHKLQMCIKLLNSAGGACLLINMSQQSNAGGNKEYI